MRRDQIVTLFLAVALSTPTLAIAAGSCPDTVLKTYKSAWTSDANVDNVDAAVKANGFTKHEGSLATKGRTQLKAEIRGVRNVDVSAKQLQGIDNLAVTIDENAMFGDVCVVKWTATGDHTRTDLNVPATKHMTLEGVTALRIEKGTNWILDETVLSSNDDEVLKQLGYH